MQLVVLGVGLIGGSLLLALRRAGAAARIVAWDPDPAALETARARGMIDRAGRDVEDAVRGGDMVVLGAPPMACEELLAPVAAALNGGAVLTDVCSVKEALVRCGRQVLAASLPRFVPGHPIAGTERSGAAAADAGLFCGCRVVLTPLPETEPEARRRVASLWRAAGAAEVIEMEPGRHDALLAATSHLPHMLAYTLADELLSRHGGEMVSRLAAGGLRGFTRVASSNPRLWTEICLANRGHIAASLESFGARLQGLAAAVRAGDRDRLHDFFRRAKALRDSGLAQRRDEG